MLERMEYPRLNKYGHNRATSCAGFATLRSAHLCRERYRASVFCPQFGLDATNWGIWPLGRSSIRKKFRLLTGVALFFGVAVAVGLIEIITSQSVLAETKIILVVGGGIFLYAITLFTVQLQNSAVCPNCQKSIIYSTGGTHFILARNVPKNCNYCGESLWMYQPHERPNNKAGLRTAYRRLNLQR